MIDIEVAFKELLAVLQAVRLYGPNHPMFDKALEKAYLDWSNIFSNRQEVTIGIVGEELAFQREVLFDLSKLLHWAIIYLKERNIEKITLTAGLSREELAKFINILAGPKEGFQGDLQDLLATEEIEHISVGKLKVSDRKDQAAFEFNQHSLYDSSADQFSQVLAGVLNFEKIDHHSLKLSLENIMENLNVQRQELLKLATVKRYDAETYTHMLNVSIFAMYLSSRLGFDKQDVLAIGMAAMFHDLGKIYISRKILHKSEKLTDLEFSQIKSHTVLGAEMLLHYVESLGILPVVVSFEHHLKYDLSGYPKFSLTRKQHIASSIVAICDVYDALSQRRGYKQDYSPDVVFNIMDKEKGSSFDPELLDSFFRFMGLWPVGAVVALSDKSIALVQSQNESDIRRPKVEVVFPEDKKRLVDLLQEKELTIERYLNPWKEGKEYLR